MFWLGFAAGFFALPALLAIRVFGTPLFFSRAAVLSTFLLIGCASTPSTELYEIARACGTKAECPEEWGRAHRKEMQETKPRKEGPRCAKGLVEWKTWTGTRCITRAEFERVLRQMQF